MALTLSPAAPDVRLTGTLDAYGAAGLYGGLAYYAAVFGPAGGDFTVHNTGIVESNGTSATDAGILLGSAGTVLNQGDIRAATGIAIFGGAGGDVHNKRDIDATLGIGVYLQGAGMVVNIGKVKGTVDGVVLAGGGYVENTGKVVGAAGILLGGGPGGYVYNTGTVTSTKRDGISLSASGYVYNTGAIRSGHAGIVMASGGMAYNSGNITAAKVGVYLANGAVYNYAKGKITGAPYGVSLGAAGYVYNAGSILGEGNKSGKFGAGVELAAGGYVYNAAGGRLTGLSGVVAHGALTLVNEGFIYGSGSNYASNAAGVYAASGGTVVNNGTISGDENFYPGVWGILVGGAAGTVTNTGLMSGYFNDAAIGLRDGGTVVNSGRIENFGGEELGILLRKGGAISNSGYVTGVYAGGGVEVTNTGIIQGRVTLTGGGVLTNDGDIGSYYGVTILGGGTVLNAGKIEAPGSSSTAVYFQPGYANELILLPGATITGSVLGGGGALELEAGTASGTINFGERFSGFADVTIDTGAAWGFAGGETLAASLAVTNDGTILALGSTGLTIGGAVTGLGTIDSGDGRLALEGSVAAGQIVLMGGADETLSLGDAGGFGGTIEGFAGGDALVLTGVKSSLVTGVSFSGGVLTVSESNAIYQFTFANPGSFAHEKFSFFRDHGVAGITLSSRSAMTFLAPADAGAAALPAAVSYVPRAPAAVPSSAAASGWLSVTQQTLGVMAPVVTLQG